MLPILLSVLGPLLGKVVDTVGSKLGVDMSSDELKGKRLEIEAELDKLIQQANLQQIAVNTEEAKNSNVFVAGWRPFIGWICGVAMGYHFIIQPLIAFVAAASGHPVGLPVFDMQSLMTVMMGMLGLGAMRSYERVYGVAREDTVRFRSSRPAQQNKNPVEYDASQGKMVYKD